MSSHDNAYKNVFSHPKAVQDLLRGFVHEDWVAQLDYSTLEKVSGSYVSDDLRDREDDIIWRIRMHPSVQDGKAMEGEGEVEGKDIGEGEGDWLYVYLLLEFQSSNDPYMAVRILTYIGLLYQDLIKSGQTNGRKLPAVFPLVLYNGERPWSAARELEELIEPVPPSLAAYRPSLRYFLMDEGRLSESSLIRYIVVNGGSATPTSAASAPATESAVRVNWTGSTQASANGVNTSANWVTDLLGTAPDQRSLAEKTGLVVKVKVKG